MAIPSLQNNFQTLLNAAITTIGATTCTVATPFANAGEYRIIIDSERMKVTAGANTTTWTITRGDQGSTPTTHAINAPIFHVMDNGGLTAMFGQFAVAGTWTADQNFGTHLFGTLQTAAQPNITSLGTLTGLVMAGTISGVTTLTATSINGTLGTAAQPNITSLGVLLSLLVNNNAGNNVPTLPSANGARIWIQAGTPSTPSNGDIWIAA